MRVIVKRLIKEGKVEEAKKIYEELVSLTRKEDGCIFYALYQDEINPRLFALMEEWQNTEVLNQHLKTEHYGRLAPKLNDLTEKKFDFEKYNQLF